MTGKENQQPPEEKKPPEKIYIITDGEGVRFTMTEAQYRAARVLPKEPIDPYASLGVQETGDGVAVPNQSFSTEIVPKK